MTTSKKTTASKEQVRKLKLRKESLKDLDVKGKAKEVKGGHTSIGCQIPTQDIRKCAATAVCLAH